MCDSCQNDAICSHQVGGWHDSSCACSVTGPASCPECGCDCQPWYDGLTLSDRPALASTLFDLAGDGAFPLTRDQLLAAVRESADSGSGPTSEDLGWLTKTLPAGTYPDPGEVLIAVGSPIQTDGPIGTSGLWRYPVVAVALGSTLVVGDEERAVLLGPQGNVYDQFGTGRTPLTPETAPRAAAASRPLAPGISRGTLRAVPVYLALRELSVPFSLITPTQSHRPIEVSGTMTGRITDPTKLLEGLALPLARPDASGAESGWLATRVGAWARNAAIASDADALQSDPAGFALSVEGAAKEAGFSGRMKVDRIGDPDPLVRMAEQMAHLPDSVRAQMAQSMSAMRTRGLASDRISSRPTAVLAPASVPSPTSIPCPHCQRPNPVNGKFCQGCGASLSTARRCPSCGVTVPPTVKFCGSCGTRQWT